MRRSRPERPDYPSYEDVDARRERRFNSTDPGNVRVQRHTLLAFVFGLSLFLLVGMVSLYQATSVRASTAVLGGAVAATTEIDLLLDEQLEPLREKVRSGELTAPYFLPGFPVEVPLTQDQVLNSSTDDLRAYLLSTSALAVYNDGLSAFESDAGLGLNVLSAAGAIDQVTGIYSETVHNIARLVALAAFVVTLISGLGLVATSQGFRRARTPGLITLIAGAAGLILLFVFQWVVSAIAGSDPLYSEFADLLGVSLDVPQRNFTIVLLLGIVLTVFGVAGELIDTRMGPQWAAQEKARDSGPLTVSERRRGRYRAPRPLLDIREPDVEAIRRQRGTQSTPDADIDIDVDVDAPDVDDADTPSGAPPTRPQDPDAN